MTCPRVHVPSVTTLERKPDGFQLPCDAGTPTAPGQNQPSALIDKRTAANRRNALKSTGPRTKAGKLAVARNGVGHGIYTLCPVIEDVESAREWKAYRKAMLADIAPVGMLETTLAERIILTAWRLGRVARYETERIRLAQEGASNEVISEIHHGAAQSGCAAIRDLGFGLSSIVAVNTDDGGENGYDEVAVRNNTELDEADAQDLLRSAHDDVGDAEPFDDYWERLPKPAAWTAGVVRQLVRELAEADRKRRSEELSAEQARRLDEYRREHLVPDEATLEKVMRYEAHLSRQFHRDLHELQRLQSVRQGQRVPAPVAIDIDVCGGPKTVPENGG